MTSLSSFGNPTSPGNNNRRKKPLPPNRSSFSLNVGAGLHTNTSRHTRRQRRQMGSFSSHQSFSQNHTNEYHDHSYSNTEAYLESIAEVNNNTQQQQQQRRTINSNTNNINYDRADTDEFESDGFSSCGAASFKEEYEDEIMEEDEKIHHAYVGAGAAAGNGGGKNGQQQRSDGDGSIHISDYGGDKGPFHDNFCDDDEDTEDDEDIEDDEEDVIRMASVSEVMSFARTRRTKVCICLAFLCSICTGLVVPGMAFYFSKAFQNLAADPAAGGAAGEQQFIDDVEYLSYAFMVLGSVIFVFITIQTALMESAAEDMTVHMKTMWFEALMRQDMAYFDIQDVSGQATMISTNGAKYRRGVGRKIVEAVAFITSFVGSVAYAFWASWKITLAALGCTPFLFGSVMFLVRMNAAQAARASSSDTRASVIVSTAVSSLRTILSLNAVDKMVEMYEAATQDSCAGSHSHYCFLGLAYGAQNISFLFGYMIASTFGSYLLYTSVFDTGCDPSAASSTGNEACDPTSADVFGALLGVSLAAADLPLVSVAVEAFYGARTACFPAIVAMSRQLEEYPPCYDHDSEQEEEVHGGDGEKQYPNTQTATTMRVVSKRVTKELVWLPKYEIDSSSPSGLKPKNVQGAIEFKNVTFCYPARKGTMVLNDFSLKIAAGKTVALVGESGSGKSTVIQLIERYYDPDKGSVTLDGHDLRSLNVSWLRKQIGLVLQEPKLFAGTIRENIICGREDLQQQSALNDPKMQEQIESVAKTANAHDFIRKFPSKYETMVGDLGGQLSGGQKQRIAIARVLCKSPRILLLDEATSALDSESEATVQKALDKLMKFSHITTFVVAHRLATIKKADVICVMKGGRVVEQGSHNELLVKKGAYWDLVQAQKAKEEAGVITNRKSERDITGGGNRRVSYVDLSVFRQDANRPPFIQFKEVYFSYPARRDALVLRGMNLTIYHGETLAVVGPSGSGKSTIVSLLERFYQPERGSVTFNGVDLREINVNWLRSQFGLVSQEATLFNMTVEDNIKFGCPEAHFDDVVDAALKAHCHDFIMKFPDQYQTMLGEGSNLVSGGQRQRIAIARALVRQPPVFLFDEATSALDSESEKIVQEALDALLGNAKHTCIVIAHRLSTIRNADRIAVVYNGKVREIGTHEELMKKPHGYYKRLHAFQNLDANPDGEVTDLGFAKSTVFTNELSGLLDDSSTEESVDKKEAEGASLIRQAWLMGKEDLTYILGGAAGALIAGLFFPAWGVVFAYMIDVLYQKVEVCPPGIDCDAYRKEIASAMRQESFLVLYGYIGLGFTAIVGNIFLFWGFGLASERLNRRVRDAAFTSLIRQEIAWFDLRSPGTISSNLGDDSAVIHAFAGEPIRTLILNVASVVVGVAISFAFMWPFALLSLALIPFMGFGTEMEMRIYNDDDDEEEAAMKEIEDITSPGAIVIESLSNMRTVASLSLERQRVEQFQKAQRAIVPDSKRKNFFRGMAAGFGQFVQFWSYALMFWWGGYLLLKIPSAFSYREFLISMYALFFSLYGLAVAAQGAVNRPKATAAAHRIFALINRKSKIDPLSTEGKSDLTPPKVRISFKPPNFKPPVQSLQGMGGGGIQQNSDGESISTHITGDAGDPNSMKLLNEEWSKSWVVRPTPLELLGTILPQPEVEGRSIGHSGSNCDRKEAPKKVQRRKKHLRRVLKGLPKGKFNTDEHVSYFL